MMAMIDSLFILTKPTLTVPDIDQKHEFSAWQLQEYCIISRMLTHIQIRQRIADFWTARQHKEGPRYLPHPPK